MIGLALLLATALHFVWHSADPGVSVQYGVPGTDDRALRIDCADGRIEILGPAQSDLREGAAVSVVFITRSGRERRRGTIAYLGDGNNFDVVMRHDDPALRALLAGQALRIERSGSHWTVPGRGAAVVLRPLVANCRNEATR